MSRARLAAWVSLGWLASGCLPEPVCKSNDDCDSVLAHCEKEPGEDTGHCQQGPADGAGSSSSSGGGRSSSAAPASTSGTATSLTSSSGETAWAVSVQGWSGVAPVDATVQVKVNVNRPVGLGVLSLAGPDGPLATQSLDGGPGPWRSLAWSLHVPLGTRDAWNHVDVHATLSLDGVVLDAGIVGQLDGLPPAITPTGTAQFLAAPDSPLHGLGVAPTQAAPGGAVLLVGQAPEALAPDSVANVQVSGLDDGGSLRAGVDGSQVWVEATFARTQTDNPELQVSLEARDLAGNPGTFTWEGPVPLRGTTALQSTVPQVQARVRYLRQPWNPDGGPGRFTLVPRDADAGIPLTVAAGSAPLLAVVVEDRGGRPMGGAALAEDGWPPFDLHVPDGGTDTASVQLRFVGNQGIASAPVPVLHVEYLAPGLRAGDGGTPGIVNVGAVRDSLTQEGVDAGANPLHAEASQGWRETVPQGAAAVNFPAGAVAAYDSVRDVVVAFGPDVDGGAVTQDWDGRTWTRRASSPTGPSPRTGTSMVFDARRGSVVLVGGKRTADGALLDDLWEWNGDTWTNPTLSGPKPSARQRHAMAFHHGLGATVLFGGEGDSALPLADAWTWDGRAWAPLAEGSEALARSRAAMTYDPATDTLLLCGGERATTSGPATLLQDAWTGAYALTGEWNWQSLAELPEPMAGATLTQDWNRGVAVLVGGTGSEASGWPNRILEFDGRTWNAAPERPVGSLDWAARVDHAAAYLHSTGKTLVLGGTPLGGDFLALYQWDGRRTSTPPSPADLPTAELNMLADESQGTVMITGTVSDEFGQRVTSLGWDGTSVVPGPAFMPRQDCPQAPVAYDGLRHRFLALTGDSCRGGLLAWDPEFGGSSDPMLTNLPTTGNPVMAVDPDRTLLVVVDATMAGQNPWTFECALENLTEGCHDALASEEAFRPGSLTEPALVYDPAAHRMLLAGCQGTTRRAFEYGHDGLNGAWSTVAISDPSSITCGHHAATFDRVFQQVVWVGGDANHVVTWRWDWNAQWVQLSSSPGRLAEAPFQVAADSGRGTLVALRTPASGPWSLWEWDVPSRIPSRLPPARVLRAPAGTPPSTPRGLAAMPGGGWTTHDAVDGKLYTFTGEWTRSATSTAYTSGETVVWDSRHQWLVGLGSFNNTNPGWLYNGTAFLGLPVLEPPVTTQLLHTAAVYLPGRQSVMVLGAWGNPSEPGKLLFLQLQDAQAVNWFDPGLAFPEILAQKGHAMAWDERRGVVVLFGGQDSTQTVLGDLFEWFDDGAAGNWTRLTPAPQENKPWPAPRTNHGMTYDPLRGTTLVHGGTDENGNALHDVWEWDGAAWRELTPVSPAAWKDAPAVDMVADGSHQRLVALVQPTSGGTTFLEWTEVLSTLPAVQLTWDLQALGVDPTTLSRAEMEMDCRGTWQSGEVQGSGGTVCAWTGRWECQDTAPGGGWVTLEAPGMGANGTVSAQCRPARGSDVARAVSTADLQDARLRLQYTLPE